MHSSNNKTGSPLVTPTQQYCQLITLCLPDQLSDYSLSFISRSQIKISVCARSVETPRQEER